VGGAAGVSAEGGATDQCRDNLRFAWPLLQQLGQTPRGLFLLSQAARRYGPKCKTVGKSQSVLNAGAGGDHGTDHR
jgi:hypothetical protein